MVGRVGVHVGIDSVEQAGVCALPDPPPRAVSRELGEEMVDAFVDRALVGARHRCDGR